MNTPILFLLGAFALASLATLVVWIASRPRKERFGQSIETFSRDLSALAPNGRHDPSASQQSPRSAKPGPRQRATAANGTPSTHGRRPGPRPVDSPERKSAASSDGR